MTSPPPPDSESTTAIPDILDQTPARSTLNPIATPAVLPLGATASTAAGGNNNNNGNVSNNLSITMNGHHRRVVTGIVDAPRQHERQLTDLGGMMDTLSLHENASSAMLPFLNGLTAAAAADNHSGITNSNSGLHAHGIHPPVSNPGLPSLSSSSGIPPNNSGLQPLLNGGLLQPSSSSTANTHTSTTHLIPPGLVNVSSASQPPPPGLESILSNSSPSPSTTLSSQPSLVPSMMENAIQQTATLVSENNRMTSLPSTQSQQEQLISGALVQQQQQQQQPSLIPSMVPQQSIQEKIEQQLVQEKQQQVIKAQQDQIEQLKAQLQQQQQQQMNQPQQQQPPPTMNNAPMPPPQTNTRPPPITHEDTTTTTNIPAHTYTGRIPSNKQDSRKLFVGGLPAEITDESFLRFFETYGPVIDSVVLLDRRTKRSRGFGFVTFRDEETALNLLNVIPGRTGRVAMNGKMCEIKASEPKTEEVSQYNEYHRRSYPNGPNMMGGHHPHSHHVGSRGYPGPYYTHHHHPPPPMISGMPYNSFTPEGNPAIYSHSTVTRANGSEGGGAEGGGGQPSVYIQNNYYTLPSSEGSGVPGEGGGGGGGTGEGYQMQQQQQQQQHAPFAYPGGAAWEPSYPGPMEDGGQDGQDDYSYGGAGM